MGGVSWQASPLEKGDAARTRLPAPGPVSRGELGIEGTILHRRNRPNSIPKPGTGAIPFGISGRARGKCSPGAVLSFYHREAHKQAHALQ